MNLHARFSLSRPSEGDIDSRVRNRTRTSRYRPSVDALEDRVVLSSSAVSLGTAGQFAVLGLKNAPVLNLAAVVNGNEGVSAGGSLVNIFGSTITGNVTEAASGQFFGRGGVLSGSLSVNASAMTQADSAALSASSQASGLTPTQTYGTITHPTTVTGNGGLNVININGSVHNSLTLSGTASDVFVVNITGNVDLIGSAALGLAGGVTAGHVLYNVTGHGGIDILSRNAQDGTLLAPNGDVLVDGTFNGELIGGRSVTVLPGATVNPAPFSIPSPPTASLSGFVISGNTPLAGVTVVLTGVDNQSNAVNLSATTDATGAYSFTALQPGTYTIEVPQVPGDTFTASVGSVAGSFGDGTVDPAGDITGIVLTAGQSGTDFDFTAAAHIISA